MNPVPASARTDESLVGLIADEFTERLQRGEQPDIEEYVRRYPELAALLREALPALQALGTKAPETPGRLLTSPERVEGCLGDFRLVRQVGRGGMGIVYEAEQLSLGRRVALKMLPFAAAQDARQLQRFRNEAMAAACLHHANIVPVFGVGCERGVHYYAMQFIDGQTLADVIRELRTLAGMGRADDAQAVGDATESVHAEQQCESEGRRDIAQPAAPPTPAAETFSVVGLVTTVSTRSPAYFQTVARLASQAAEALEHAHQFGVVHRDIKPANLLLDPSGNLWITDFGLARLRCQAPGLTMTGDLLGTLRYMSPEQALGKRVAIDHRTDIYSLGVTLYELLTLEPAYTGRERVEVLRQITLEEPRPPRKLNRAIPVELETIALKAMAKDPEDRYASAQELADDLRRFREDKPIHARRPNLAQRAVKWARRHKPLVFSLSASLALLAAGLMATLYLYADNQHRVAGERQQLMREKDQILYGALLDHAGALQMARQPGYREHVWRALHDAASLDPPSKDPQRLQSEALACLGDPIGLDAGEPSQVERARSTRVPKAIQEFQKAIPEKDRLGFLYATTPDGERVGGWCPMSRTLMIWREDGTDAQSTQELPLGMLYDLKFTPDGQRLVAGCEEGVAMWPVFPLGRPSVFRGGNATSIAIDPRGKLLATGGRQIDLWSLVSNRPIASFKVPIQGAKVEFSADGKFLLAVVDDQVLMAWPVRDTPEKQYLEGHHGGVPTVAFSPDGRRLASASKDLTVKLWDAESAEIRHVCKGHTSPIESLSFSPDGKLLASGDFGGGVCLWDTGTGKGLGHVGDSSTPGQIWRLQFDPAGKFVVAGGMTGIAAWALDKDARTLEPAPFVRLEWPGVYDLAIHPNRRELAFVDRTGRLGVYDLAHAAGPWTLPVRARPQLRGLHFDPSGQQLLFLCYEGNLATWDWPNGLRATPTNQKAFQLAVSKDGQWIATTSSAHEVRIIDLRSQQPVLTLPAESSEIWSLAWSPDGSRLAIGLSDGGLVVWRPEQVRTKLAEFRIAMPSMLTTVSAVEPQPAQRCSFEHVIRMSQFRDRVTAPRWSDEFGLTAADALAVRETLLERLEEWQHRAWSDAQTYEYHHGRALSHLLLAVAYRLTRDFGAARRHQDQAKLIYSQLVGYFKENIHYRDGLAICCLHDAALHKAIGHPDDAVLALRQCTALREQLRKDFPGIVVSTAELAIAYNQLGVALQATGQRDEAVQFYVKALDLLKELQKKFPKVNEYTIGIATVSENLSKGKASAPH
jgi:serine/threonine protein kinase/WD40 repeat protein